MALCSTNYINVNGFYSEMAIISAWTGPSDQAVVSGHYFNLHLNDLKFDVQLQQGVLY